jgi:putative membrane protein insertion efficiency factor
MNDFHYLAVWGAIIVIMYFTIRVLKFYIIDFLIKLIRLYQKTFSPDHGIFKHNYPAGYCKFHPTCSDYAIQSLRKYGLIKGGLKAIWRILRCNPLSKGGIDTLK